MEFLDANIILRYLTRDDPEKAERCFELFQQLKRKEIRLVTSESVLAEVVYVLSSRSLYNQPRDNIRALLYPIVTLPALKIPYRRMFLHALDLYAAANIDFEDALSVAHIRRLKIDTIVSYDQDFDRMKGIHRREP
jgi:predicted nucleic acid-binding protein